MIVINWRLSFGEILLGIVIAFIMLVFIVNVADAASPDSGGELAGAFRACAAP